MEATEVDRSTVEGGVLERGDRAGTSSLRGSCGRGGMSPRPCLRPRPQSLLLGDAEVLTTVDIRLERRPFSILN